MSNFYERRRGFLRNLFLTQTSQPPALVFQFFINSTNEKVVKNIWKILRCFPFETIFLENEWKRNKRKPKSVKGNVIFQILRWQPTSRCWMSIRQIGKFQDLRMELIHNGLFVEDDFLNFWHFLRLHLPPVQTHLFCWTPSPYP